jgi:hypothetical protein
MPGDTFFCFKVISEKIHLQMHGWPDHGTPKHTRRLLEFWRDVRQRLPPRRLVTETQVSRQTKVLRACFCGNLVVPRFNFIEKFDCSVTDKYKITNPIELNVCLEQCSMQVDGWVTLARLVEFSSGFCDDDSLNGTSCNMCLRTWRT